MQHRTDTAAAVAVASRILRQPRILLVDPWWPVWGATRTTLVALRDAGMSVTPVADGRTALNEAKQNRFQVAVVELACGARGGLHAVQVAARLLELDGAPRVLLSTAAALADDDGTLWVNGTVVPVVPAADLVAAVVAAAAR